MTYTFYTFPDFFSPIRYVVFDLPLYFHENDVAISEVKFLKRDSSFLRLLNSLLISLSTFLRNSSFFERCLGLSQAEKEE